MSSFCEVCGWTCDVVLAELDEDIECPVCGAGKDLFEECPSGINTPS